MHASGFEPPDSFRWRWLRARQGWQPGFRRGAPRVALDTDREPRHQSGRRRHQRPVERAGQHDHQGQPGKSRRSHLHERVEWRECLLRQQIRAVWAVLDRSESSQRPVHELCDVHLERRIDRPGTRPRAAFWFRSLCADLGAADQPFQIVGRVQQHRLDPGR